MRKINLPSDREKSQRTKQLLVGGVLILIMFFSVLGYSFRGQGYSEENKVDYNGFEFIRQNNFWFVDQGNLKFAFKYNPNEVERVGGIINPLDSYFKKPLYVFSESEEAKLEIYRNLDPRINPIVERIQPACLDEEECEDNLPIKTCEDNFIIIKKAETFNIIQNQSCVFIQGLEENLTQVTDEFLFKVFKITQ